MNVEPECRVLGPNDSPLLVNVAAGLFDGKVIPRLAVEFLEDPRHHLIAGVIGDRIVGFVSAVHYVHPDKPAELWIDEVGVASEYRRKGLGRRMLHVALDHARKLGCVNAWVLADHTNTAAMRLYRAAGGAPAAVPSVMFEFSLVSDPSIEQ
jgi:ribosomal protein S18 acetylase RimI-like enzyme